MHTISYRKMYIPLQYDVINIMKVKKGVLSYIVVTKSIQTFLKISTTSVGVQKMQESGGGPGAERLVGKYGDGGGSGKGRFLVHTVIFQIVCASMIGFIRSFIHTVRCQIFCG